MSARDIKLMAAVLLPATRDEQTGRMDVDRAVEWALALDARVDAVLAEREPGDGARRRGRPPKGAADPRLELDEMQRRRFERFWSSYGYKRDRARCAQLWGRLAPDAALAEVIAAAAAADARGAQNGGAVYQTGTARKHPATWLAGRCWEDDAEGAQAAATSAAEAERRGLVVERNGLLRQRELLASQGLALSEADARRLSVLRDMLSAQA